MRKRVIAGITSRASRPRKHFATRGFHADDFGQVHHSLQLI